ncbi:cupin domain-containing protein [Cupriavidus basilensis]|uniref:cupin domain-containing protein n=1 Tax=Cupriavidus basilensis TaxID=68895 RepID=UPI00283DDB70|nr:cupin domain-containing protein [Cupriavidus basilensis]MDR3384979.1 cupin domain-containing protein [Cupriavidus basilensis]
MNPIVTTASETGTPPLLEALAEVNSQPLWDRYMRLNTREPQHYEPLIWPWARMAPLIERAATEISMEQAERRVLLLTHPDFPGTVFTTPTLSGGLQVLNPGESAGAHRHTLAALRIVMTGNGAVTTVDGKRCEMRPGDLVLTPAWSWHEHCHEGSERMVWFDGLDYPLARQLGAVFFEMGPGPVPARGLADAPDASLAEGGMLPDGDSSVVPYSPLYRYAWERADRVLAAMPAAADGTRQLRYVNPADGGAVMPTIDVEALRLAPGKTTQGVRSTANAMVVAIQGEGTTEVGGTVFEWKQHDCFTLPRWQWIRHTARTPDATLMLVSDRELMRKLGYLREETAT